LKIREFLNQPNGAYILQKVMDKDKAWLILNDNLNVPKEALDILQKQKSNYPVEYIFNEAYFFGDKFFIKEGVLIPRDDTEVVVQKAIDLINSLNLKTPKVIDCCSGSGVIAIEIAKHTNAEVFATDINPLAIEIAKKNAKLHNVEVKFSKCDLLCENADILVANPPYVQTSWQKPNPYEPDNAFFGGNDGLDIIKRLISKAKNLNVKYAVIEIGFNQRELLSQFLPPHTKNFEFFNDLSGNVRGAVIEF